MRSRICWFPSRFFVNSACFAAKSALISLSLACCASVSVISAGGTQDGKRWNRDCVPRRLAALLVVRPRLVCVRPRGAPTAGRRSWAERDATVNLAHSKGSQGVLPREESREVWRKADFMGGWMCATVES